MFECSRLGVLQILIYRDVSLTNVGQGLAPAVLIKSNFYGGGTKAPPYVVGAINPPFITRGETPPLRKLVCVWGRTVEDACPYEFGGVFARKCSCLGVNMAIISH